MAPSLTRAISLGLSAPGGDDILYMVNTEANREAMQRIADGEIIVDGAQPLVAETPVGPPPDIFSLYEQNVGELTPIVAEQLTTAEKEYPDGWLADAIRKAAELNKRNWRYIQRILENWQAEGKDSGKPGKRVQGTEPGKYTRGRYGHMVRH